MSAPPDDPRPLIAVATERLSIAQLELETAMNELAVTVRSDKRMVTDRLRRAMAELVAARLDLASLVAPAG